MKLKLLFFGMVAVTALLPAQTISIVNLNNSAISPSALVGDTLTVNIMGAAANSLVTLNYSQNGSPGTWNAGSTDGSGNWTYSEAVENYKIGNWVEQWTVGGTNVGSQITLEVLDLPSTLSVTSLGASSPDACGSGYVPSGYTYGPAASIQYQIVGANGNESVPNTGLGIMLEPEESNNGGSYADLGCTSSCPSGFVWSPPSSQYATSSGTFYDVSQGTCFYTSFSNVTGSQAIAIKIGNNLYSVRNNNWVSSSSSSGHGTTTNNVDVNYTQ